MFNGWDFDTISLEFKKYLFSITLNSIVIIHIWKKENSNNFMRANFIDLWGNA